MKGESTAVIRPKRDMLSDARQAGLLICSVGDFGVSVRSEGKGGYLWEKGVWVW